MILSKLYVLFGEQNVINDYQYYKRKNVEHAIAIAGTAIVDEEAELYAFDNPCDPMDVINASAGWTDWELLSEKEFNDINQAINE